MQRRREAGDLGSWGPEGRPASQSWRFRVTDQSDHVARLKIGLCGRPWHAGNSCYCRGLPRLPSCVPWLRENGWQEYCGERESGPFRVVVRFEIRWVGCTKALFFVFLRVSPVAASLWGQEATVPVGYSNPGLLISNLIYKNAWWQVRVDFLFEVDLLVDLPGNLSVNLVKISED